MKTRIDKNLKKKNMCTRKMNLDNNFAKMKCVDKL